MIVWLSSYPKSGNTWLRLLLTNYLFENKNGVFDNLDYIINFPRKISFDFVDKSKFIGNTLDFHEYFIKAQEYINTNKKINYLKTHSCLGKINNFDFTNEKNTLGFIYLVRDPRSVVISYSHYINESIDESIEIILRENNISIGSDKIITFKSSWKINYLSWIKSSYPKLLVKYEDLYNNTYETFKKVLVFLNQFQKIIIDQDKIKKTIQNCHFNNLQEEEIKKGFDEKLTNNPFFRKGTIDEWKKVLNKKQLKKIENSFYSEMKDLNYL